MLAPTHVPRNWSTVRLACEAAPMNALLATTVGVVPDRDGLPTCSGTLQGAKTNSPVSRPRSDCAPNDGAASSTSAAAVIERGITGPPCCV